MKQSPKKAKSKSSAEKNPPLTNGQKWFFHFVAMIVLPLMLIGGIEVCLRLSGYGYSTGLFKKVKIGDREFLVNNDDFGLRFFPPQLERFTGPLKMEAKKLPGTCRIFILGESAAMGDPEPAYGPGRYLEALLAMRYPKTHFEVVNLGITAINSHVILPVARDCAKREGDIWLIYMGNNEMVGPFGAATVFGAKAPPLPLIRLNLAIQKLRLGQLLVSLGRKMKGASGDKPSWGGMEMFVGNKLSVDDPRKEMVYQNFSKNLDDIVKSGVNSGAKVILNTVAVNLKDCGPFASLNSTNLGTYKKAEFDRAFRAGAEAADRGLFTEAVQQLNVAEKIDPTFAEVQYRLGQSTEAAKDLSGARSRFQLACDYDALPFRTDSRINKSIRDEAQKVNGNNFILFDAAATLASQTPENICGDETFYEHVHFDFDGSYRLGLAWAEQVSKLLRTDIASQGEKAWPTRETCEIRLGLSEWNRALVIQHMIKRMQQPPLSEQLHNDARIKLLQDRVAAIQAGFTPEKSANARKHFQDVLAQEPDDFVVRENFALFLQATGDSSQAAAEWQKVHEALPQDYLADFQLGHLFNGQGKYAQAEQPLDQAVRLHPSFAEGWAELGNAHAGEEKFESALADYHRARQLRPQDPQTILQMAKTLARMKRHDEALKEFREAIKLNPQNWETHFELGGELDSQNQFDVAAAEFAEATRLNPEYSRTHFNYGVLLAKQGRLGEAQREFEATLRLEPANEKARSYLEKLKSMKNPRP